MKTLPLWRWEKSSDGYMGYVRSAAGDFDYTGAVVRDDKQDTWFATLTVNGSLVYQAEHLSRPSAMKAAFLALKRAIRIREFND